MEIRPAAWSFSRSSLVQTFIVLRSVPACGRLAARKGMVSVPRVLRLRSENTRRRFISLSLVSLRRRGGKMLEHFVHTFAKVLRVLVGLVRERIARGASPDQLLCLCIEEIDH